MKPINPKQLIFYVYVYLDPRKPGKYVYGEYEFDYEPFYIGKGKGNRDKQHLNENKYNQYFNNKIKKIQKTLGIDPIIIRQYDNISNVDACKFEIEMIKNIGRKDLKLGTLCNLTNGGDEGSVGRILSEETKRKMSEKKKGWIPPEEWKEKKKKESLGINNPFYGKQHTDKTKKKIGDKNRNRIVTEETRRKISEKSKITSKGKNNPMYKFKWIITNISTGEQEIVHAKKEWCEKNNMNLGMCKYYVRNNKIINGLKFERI